MNYTIDTHSAVKILKEESFNEKKAKAIVGVVMKAYFANFEKEFVRNEIQSSKAEAFKWMFCMFFVFSSAQLGILMIILKSFFEDSGGV